MNHANFMWEDYRKAPQMTILNNFSSFVAISNHGKDLRMPLESPRLGYAEYNSLEAVFAVLKLLNNAALTVEGTTSRLLVKSDEKT